MISPFTLASLALKFVVDGCKPTALIEGGDQGLCRSCGVSMYDIEALADRERVGPHVQGHVHGDHAVGEAPLELLRHDAGGHKQFSRALDEVETVHRTEAHLDGRVGGRHGLLQFGRCGCLWLLAHGLSSPFVGVEDGAVFSPAPVGTGVAVKVATINEDCGHFEKTGKPFVTDEEVPPTRDCPYDHALVPFRSGDLQPNDLGRGFDANVRTVLGQ